MSSEAGVRRSTFGVRRSMADNAERRTPDAERAFTLIEVAVAGSLIALCLLAAIGIIPSGLRIQNETRMRAVAAATVMRLSAEAGPGATVRSRLVAEPASALRIESWNGKGVVDEAAPTDAYHIEPLPAVDDLSRRVVFTLNEREHVRLITAWLLNRDPASADAKRATYLATFTEAL